MTDVKSSRTPVAWFVVAALIILFAWLIWPTNVKHTQMEIGGSVHPVRIHRWTGKAEILFDDGWRDAADRKRQGQVNASAQKLPVPFLDLLKIEAGGTLGRQLYSHGDGYWRGKVYNGNTYRIDFIRVQIHIWTVDAANPDNQRTLMNREYDTQCRVLPKSGASCEVSLGWENFPVADATPMPTLVTPAPKPPPPKWAWNVQVISAHRLDD